MSDALSDERRGMHVAALGCRGCRETVTITTAAPDCRERRVWQRTKQGPTVYARYIWVHSHSAGTGCRYSPHAVHHAPGIITTTQHAVGIQSVCVWVEGRNGPLIGLPTHNSHAVNTIHNHLITNSGSGVVFVLPSACLSVLQTLV